VTNVPTTPLPGEKLVTVGLGPTVTVKLSALVAVPAAVVTAIWPVVAPDGTVAVICVGVLTVNVAAVAPNVTADAPVKSVPVIVTDVPTGPLVGLKFEIVGAAATTVKFELLVAVPPGAVTEIGPVVAPAGTVTIISVSELVKPVALVPLNVTLETPVKLVPVTVTDVPTDPLVGLKLAMIGAC